MPEEKYHTVSWNEDPSFFFNHDALVACQDLTGKVNLITIGWKSLGFLWNMPIATIAVRPDRYSHQLLERGVQAFTINLGGDVVENNLDYCGTYSGQSVDKVKARNITLKPCKHIPVPFIDGAKYVYGCEIVHKTDSGNITKHTLYYGKIIEVHKL